jgi:hypothetical protein
MAGRVVADARVVCQRAQVEQLARASGAELEEHLELRQIAYVQDQPQIPFHVGAEVEGRGPGGIQAPVEDAGVEPRVWELLDARRRASPVSLLQAE